MKAAGCGSPLCSYMISTDSVRLQTFNAFP